MNKHLTKNDIPNGIQFGQLTTISHTCGYISHYAHGCPIATHDAVKPQLAITWTRFVALHQTHGDSQKRLYGIWRSMRTRCSCLSDTSYGDYGARGIVVCPEWEIYTTFRSWAIANGYAENLTIDRIDNDGPYCPTNCRWISSAEQQNKTRRSRYLTIEGEKMTLAEWARDPRCQVGYQTLKTRVLRGWGGEAALLLPR